MFTKVNIALFTFVIMITITQISNWYPQYFEARLSGRYICSKHINPLLVEYQKMNMVEVVGSSEKGENIHLIKIGSGPKKVLAWSQMHGNESTTTKAVFDLLKFLCKKNDSENGVFQFISEWTLYIIPILNPDGAKLYTRENANDVDLNRDAQDVTQKESRVLREVFEKVQPDFCWNLHDQRTMYSLPNSQPATISFLSPAADEKKSKTPSRKTSMKYITQMASMLDSVIPGKVGRYDDAFNINCVGDTFQASGVPTILFEAGHYPNDYHREKTREFVFYAFLSFLGIINSSEKEATMDKYYQIPENEKNFRDIVLRNVCLKGRIVDIAIQFQEKLQDNAIKFVPIVDDILENCDKIGHKEFDIEKNEILINSHENVFVNEEIATISFKLTRKPIIL